MDFELTEEQKSIRSIMAEFVERKVIPIADEIDRTNKIPDELLKEIGNLGFFGLRYPEEYGGAGADTLTFCIACEELARGSLAVAWMCTMQAFQCTDFIYRYGKEEHKQRWLVPAIKGEKWGAFCLTEPGGGSDLSALRTSIRREKDEYIINGSKTWVTNGPIADFYIVAVMVDRSKGMFGIDFVVVERENTGLIVGKDIPKDGLRGVRNCEIMFRDCRVPIHHALAGIGEGKGGKYLSGILAEIRVVTAALALGLTRAALDTSIEYSKGRVAFGKPIGKHQAIGFKIATIATELEAARVFTYYAAWLLEKKGREDPEVIKVASMAKNFACELAQRAVDAARRIYGGYSMSEEMRVNRYYRDAGSLLWGGGTTEINNLIIARELGI